MTDYLTDKEIGGKLYQHARNMWDVHEFCTEELNDLSATVTHAVISFPYKIHVLGSRVELITANSSTMKITLTDGTNAIDATVDAGNTFERQKSDQAYSKDTRLHIQSNAVAGLTTATARFMFFYAIDERKTI